MPKLTDDDWSHVLYCRVPVIHALSVLISALYLAGLLLGALCFVVVVLATWRPLVCFPDGSNRPIGLASVVIRLILLGCVLPALFSFESVVPYVHISLHCSQSYVSVLYVPMAFNSVWLWRIIWLFMIWSLLHLALWHCMSSSTVLPSWVLLWFARKWTTSGLVFVIFPPLQLQWCYIYIYIFFCVSIPSSSTVSLVSVICFCVSAIKDVHRWSLSMLQSEGALQCRGRVIYFRRALY